MSLTQRTLDFDADHCVIPESIRRLARGCDPEDLIDAHINYLHELGLRDHIIVRCKRTSAGKRGQKGPPELDADGWPIILGLMPFVPTRKREALDEGIEVRISSQRQARQFKGKTIRNVFVANHVLDLLEQQEGVLTSALSGSRHQSGSDGFAPLLSRGGTPLRAAASIPPVTPPPETFGALLEVLRRELPATSHSASVVSHLERFMNRVARPEIDFRSIDSEGWQALYHELLSIPKVDRMTKAAITDAGGRPVIISIDYANLMWDGVVSALEFALERHWIEHNPARLVRRRRRRGSRNRGQRPLSLAQTRTVELTARALGAAARAAVSDGHAPAARVPFGVLPVRDRCFHVQRSQTLANDAAITLDFHVIAVAGVAFIQLAGCKYRYPASALELMILLQYADAPRISELLTVCEDAIDADAREVVWERRRVPRSGRAQLNGRLVPPVQYGTKGSREGDPIIREQPLSLEVCEAWERWQAERQRLLEATGWQLPESSNGGVVFPSIHGGLLTATIARGLVHAVQMMAGVPVTKLHRARHGLHSANAAANIDIEVTAKHLGQTVKTAFEYYRMVTAAGEELSLEASARWRALADQGLSDKQIRAALRHPQPIPEPAARPRVIDGGLPA